MGRLVPAGTGLERYALRHWWCIRNNSCRDGWPFLVAGFVRMLAAAVGLADALSQRRYDVGGHSGFWGLANIDLDKRVPFG